MDPVNFPFTAIVGHQPLKLALILNAIDQRIGGVLISGPRGSAKSTLARALTDVADIDSKRFVNLPLGATEERVIGSVDVGKVIHQGEVTFKPGLLYQAHQGVLYVDEVNLLADTLVDILLDAAASGINTVERDGVSKSHPAQFLLMGTMNPDEGELRPQLLDRFGLMVQLQEEFDIEQRMLIVERRLAFDSNSKRFCASYQKPQVELSKAIKLAKQNLSGIEVSESSKRYICELCHNNHVEGVRADITLRRTAVAYAAWQDSACVTTAMIDEVAEFVLCHRRDSLSQNNRLRQDSAEQNMSPKDQDHASASKTTSQGQYGEMPPIPVNTGEVRDVSTLMKSARLTTNKALKKKPVPNTRW